MSEPTTKTTADQRGARSNTGRRDQMPTEPKEFEELTINIDRVSRVVKGGRSCRFKALVAIGNGKNKVGVGVAKGADVQAAIAKATSVAKKSLITIAIANGTIPHDAEIKLSGAQVLIKPASPGTGIIAGGVVRSIIGLTGIKNMLSKSLGSTNKVNIAYATIEALKSLVPKEEWLNVTTKKVNPPKLQDEVLVGKEVNPPKLSKKVLEDK